MHLPHFAEVGTRPWGAHITRCTFYSLDSARDAQNTPIQQEVTHSCQAQDEAAQRSMLWCEAEHCGSAGSCGKCVGRVWLKKQMGVKPSHAAPHTPQSRALPIVRAPAAAAAGMVAARGSAAVATPRLIGVCVLRRSSCCRPDRCCCGTHSRPVKGKE